VGSIKEYVDFTSLIRLLFAETVKDLGIENEFVLAL
jgi:hypothetical protein